MSKALDEAYKCIRAANSPLGARLLAHGDILRFGMPGAGANAILERLAEAVGDLCRAEATRMAGLSPRPAEPAAAHFNPAAQSTLFVAPPQVGNPTEPGWYIARKKSWPVYDGPVFVKVTDGPASGLPLRVWQTGDERPWPVDDWDWKARLSGL